MERTCNNCDKKCPNHDYHNCCSEHEFSKNSLFEEIKMLEKELNHVVWHEWTKSKLEKIPDGEIVVVMHKDEEFGVAVKVNSDFCFDRNEICLAGCGCFPLFQVLKPCCYGHSMYYDSDDTPSFKWMTAKEAMDNGIDVNTKGE